jgi:hypothetical protein
MVKSLSDLMEKFLHRLLGKAKNRDLDLDGLFSALIRTLS